MASTEDKFRSWFREKLSCSPVVTRVEIQHTKAEGLPSVVDTFAVEERSHEAADKLTRRAWESCDNHASAFGKVQVYAVVAMAGDRAASEFLLRIKGTGTEQSVGDSEPATTAGMVAQMMRHNEALMKFTIESVSKMSELIQDMHEATTRPILQENLSLRNRVSEMEGTRLETFKLTEELASESAERKLMALAHEKDQARKDKAFNSLAKVLPQLLQGSKGGIGAILENAKDEDESPTIIDTPKIDPNLVALVNFAKTLTKKDADGFKEHLSPEKWRGLATIVRMVSEGADQNVIKENLAEYVNSLSPDDVVRFRTVLGPERNGALMEILIKFAPKDDAPDSDRPASH